MGYKTGSLLGQITKTSGYEGALVVRLEKEFIENIPDMESVFVEVDGRPVPFFIEWSEYTGSDLLRLKFSGYDSVNRAEEYKGCRVFLTVETGPAPVETDPGTLIGFSVYTTESKNLGIIKELIINPGQILLNVESISGNEILIPLHDDLIRGIDHDKKIIFMELPEGLAEINI